MSIKNEKHPSLEEIFREIEKQEVIILENISPNIVYNQENSVHHLAICINTGGSIRLQYDMENVTFDFHDIAVILPDHPIKFYESSPDYQATMIFISKDFHDELKRQSGTRYLQYHKAPKTNLDDEQFRKLQDAIHLLQTVSNAGLADRHEAMKSLLVIFFNMVDIYHSKAGNSNPRTYMAKGRNEDLFSRFFDLIVKHHQHAHDVTFYANSLCLTPKYFSTIIRQISGTSAAEWISGYITIQAKSMLANRKDLSIQAISELLGFYDQASFCRFFKHHTGMTPSHFKKQNINLR